MTIKAHELNNAIRNNAFMAGGALLVTGVMATTAHWVNATVMGSDAFSGTKVGICAASAVMISALLLERKLPDTDPFSMAIGKAAGAATTLALSEPCGWPIALAIGATTAAFVAAAAVRKTFSE